MANTGIRLNKCAVYTSFSKENSVDPDQMASNEASWSAEAHTVFIDMNDIDYVILHHQIDWKLELIFLFDLILYVPVNNLSVTSGWVFLGWTSTKLGLMCLAQGHNTEMQVRLEPVALPSRVKHSTTEPLRSAWKLELHTKSYQCMHIRACAV